MKKKINIVGMIISLAGFALAFIWFGWKLVLILVLVIWGNNMERVK